MFIICSAGYMEERVRLNKLKEVLKTNNEDFTYWGWLRGKKYKKDNTTYKHNHLWIGGGYANKILVLHYPLWIISVFIKALTLNKNEFVYAVGLDVSLPVYLASKVKGFKYLFDNPDNFSLTYNLKGLKKDSVESIEKRIAKNAQYHIIPSESRFPSLYGNEVYIPNFPLESEYIKAKDILEGKILPSYNIEKIKNDQRFKIYINGRITKPRGSEWIANTIKELDEKLFQIIIAGDVNCNILKDLTKKKSNIVLFERLANYEALSIYMLVDIVYAFYDPVIPINIKAEPNKWWDCVKCNVAFVSNSEIKTLKTFKEKDACFHVDYNDTDALKHLMLDLEKNSSKISKVKDNLNKLDAQDWKISIEKILKECV